MEPNQPSPADQKQPPDFETALARMEAIVFELEEGRIGLAEALARYEEGVGLLRQCFALLETAERRIELLTGVDSAGNPVVEAYDATATAERAEPTSARSRQHTAGGMKPAKTSRAASKPAADTSTSNSTGTEIPADSPLPPVQPRQMACDPDAPPGEDKMDAPGRLF
jgi:exodeoxyribonuclease VII small subunit